MQKIRKTDTRSAMEKRKEAPFATAAVMTEGPRAPVKKNPPETGELHRANGKKASTRLKRATASGSISAIMREIDLEERVAPGPEAAR